MKDPEDLRISASSAMVQQKNTSGLHNGWSTLCYVIHSWDAKLGKKQAADEHLNAPIELSTGGHKDYQNGLFIADKHLGAYYEGLDVC